MCLLLYNINCKDMLKLRRWNHIALHLGEKRITPEIHVKWHIWVGKTLRMYGKGSLIPLSHPVHSVPIVTCNSGRQDSRPARHFYPKFPQQMPVHSQRIRGKKSGSIILCSWVCQCKDKQIIYGMMLDKSKALERVGTDYSKHRWGGQSTSKSHRCLYKK